MYSSSSSKFSKRLCRAQETVSSAGNRFARQHAVFNGVFGLAAVLGPAVEIFAVEKIYPVVRQKPARAMGDTKTKPQGRWQKKLRLFSFEFGLGRIILKHG